MSFTFLLDKKIKKKNRLIPCFECGATFLENFVVGKDKLLIDQKEADELILEHYERGTVLCLDCLTK